MAGGAVDSPSGGGSGGQRNKDKQSMLSVNIKQVRGCSLLFRRQSSILDCELLQYTFLEVPRFVLRSLRGLLVAPGVVAVCAAGVISAAPDRGPKNSGKIGHLV